MKKTPHLLIVLFVLASRSVFACPHCNIHNYMYSSVFSAKNIVQGVVLENEKEGWLKVKVTAVLKGNYPFDTIVNVNSVFFKKNDTGIFCLDIDPLAMNVEDSFFADEAQEICYLLRSDSMAQNASEARALINGISNESVSGALTYYQYHYQASFPALCLMLDSAFSIELAEKQRNYIPWRLKNICRAYFSDTSAASKVFLMQMLERYTSELSMQKNAAVRHQSFTADLLAQVLTEGKKFYGHELADWAREKLKDAQLCSEMVYALLSSNSNTCAEIQAMVTPANTESYGWGVYHYARQMYQEWQWKKVEESLALAQSKAVSEELFSSIQTLQASNSTFIRK